MGTRLHKLISFLLISSFFCFFTSCTDAQYGDWQTIVIKDYGTLKIPSDWKSYTEDEYLYIVDSNDKPMMIQTYSFCGINDGEEGIVESNKYAESVQCIKTLSSSVFSNSAVYGKIEVFINNIKYQRFFVDISGYPDEAMLILFWDSNVNEDMVKKIAKSYEEDMGYYEKTD